MYIYMETLFFKLYYLAPWIKGEICRHKIQNYNTIAARRFENVKAWLIIGVYMFGLNCTWAIFVSKPKKSTEHSVHSAIIYTVLMNNAS